MKRPGVTTLMKTLAYKQAEVNRTLWCIAQDVQLGRSEDCVRTARIRAVMF
ncbi:hypothetical protein [Pectobacterium brasiliense]